MRKYLYEVTGEFTLPLLTRSAKSAAREYYSLTEKCGCKATLEAFYSEGGEVRSHPSPLDEENFAAEHTLCYAEDR